MKWKSLDREDAPEAVWFLRRQDAVAARQTEDAFQTWLAASPAHGLRYGQCELIWERAGELASDPEVQLRLQRLDAPVRIRKLRTATGWAGWAAAAAVVLAVAGALTLQWLQAPVYQTAIGEQRDVRLPDGSRITLNTASRVVVRYDSEGRHIELTAGEAIFDVHPEPARPFEVVAGAGVTRALGTRFAVEHVNRGVTVSVLDGIVEIVRARGESRLVPALERGQAASVTDEGVVSYVGTANLSRILAWQDRKLEFDAERLAQAIAEVNRYSPRRLTLGNPELADVRVSGLFKIPELDGFALALRDTFGLRVVENAEGWLVLPGMTGEEDP